MGRYNSPQQILFNGSLRSERTSLNSRDKPAWTLCLPEKRRKMRDGGWRMGSMEESRWKGEMKT